MKPGDMVNWAYRPRGGYGYTVNVAAVVEKVGSKRVMIRVARRTESGAWATETRWVDKSNVTNRSKYVPEVDCAGQD